MFKAINDEAFNETMEETESIYLEFREKGMEPGPAAGRTLYELGDDFGKNQPALYFVALATFILLYSKEKKPNLELISESFLNLQKVFDKNRKEIKTFFKELSKENQWKLSNVLEYIEFEKPEAFDHTNERVENKEETKKVYLIIEDYEIPHVEHAFARKDIAERYAEEVGDKIVCEVELEDEAYEGLLTSTAFYSLDIHINEVRWRNVGEETIPTEYKERTVNTYLTKRNSFLHEAEDYNGGFLHKRRLMGGKEELGMTIRMARIFSEKPEDENVLKEEWKVAGEEIAEKAFTLFAQGAKEEEVNEWLSQIP